MFFSEVFKVEFDVIEKYGAVDISLISDTPLFIDPMLIFGSSKEEYIKLNEKVTKYFHFLYLKSKSRNQTKAEIETFFNFSEVKNNWFGYSKKGNGGSGNGIKFAHELYNSLYKIFDTNNISASFHIEKLFLIGKGSGKDKISDMFTNILIEYFLEYTENFAKKYIDEVKRQDFVIDNVEIDFDKGFFKPKTFNLPFIINNEGLREYVLLTPKDILRTEEPAINIRSFNRNFNNILNTIDNMSLRGLIWIEIKARVSEYEKSLSKGKKISKSKYNSISKSVLQDLAQDYPEIYDYYIKFMENEGHVVVKDSEEERDLVLKIFNYNIKEVLDTIDIKKFNTTTKTAKEEAVEKLLFFKNAIENNDLYKIFYQGDNALKREDVFQRIFRLVWIGTDFKLSVESNNGRGPVDFNVSEGILNQVNIEFKLASNPKLNKVFKQLQIYDKAHDVKESIVVVAYFNSEDKNKVEKLKNEFRKDIRINDNFFELDCSPKLSASKVS